MSVVPAALSDRETESAIAVVGIACRLPGASSPAAFWRLLSSGRHAVTSVPAGRWGRRAGAETGLGAETGAGTGAGVGAAGDSDAAAMEHGAFLDGPDLFDAEFFGISPREAAAMDPQQRLMLEIGWEAIEDAGLHASDLADRRTGVFVGAIGDDYATLLRRRGAAAVTHHTLTGLNRGMIANRLSYLLGARGPSMVIDTGQSSSLVAVHTACQSLRAGECETALAGGLHLNLAFDSTLSVARFGGLSPDGRCFVLDSRANGFVRGEGGGLVLLKPLTRALADGDRIHGVLRGSAVNNDGGGDTLTTPSRSAQEDVLRRACAAASVAPEELQYVELHGTGTAVGDPIEAAALAQTVAGAHPRNRPLLVGSAKTNVGHLEGAAGITGLIKVLLSLKARQLPPSLNFRTANPAVPLDDWNLRVQTELSPWPRPDVPLVAGVSAFGVGGTNAHVIVSEAPVSSAVSASVSSPVSSVGSGGVAADRTLDALPWVISARTPDGLRGQAARLRDAVAAGDASRQDIGWSLAGHRTALEHRAAVVADDLGEFLSGLDALASGEPAGHVVTGTAGLTGSASADGGVVFVFPGQGAQWVGMAAELLRTSPVFAESVEECARALAPHVDWDLRDVLKDTSDGGALQRVDILQPTLWAVMVSLARVWRSLGVVPSAVIGHSQGEIAAACVAGALSLDDAALLIALRSRIAGRLTDKGAMASMDAPAERAAEFLAGRDDAWIAAVNSPSATVVAGSPEAVAEVVARAESAGHRTRTVENAYASHTPHVEEIRDELLRRVASISPRTADVSVYSTAAAGPLPGETLDADYWYRNLRETVRFKDTIQTLVDEGNTLFLEVSPHPVLTNAVRETARAASAVVATAGTLRRDKGGRRQLLTSLTQLWADGAAVDWAAVFDGTGARRTDLPTYAFQRRRYWFEDAGRDDAGFHDAGLAEAGFAEAGPGEMGSREVGPGVTGDAPVRAATVPPADAARQVRAHVAAVLGLASPDGLDTGRRFKDLGFDSIMLGELSNRINAALGLGLTTATLFDHPTPAKLAAHVTATGPTGASTVSAPAPAGRTGPPEPAGDDDPIAIIAMSCRLPGGADSPEALWQLVASERDAISAFPEDRGWDLERLHGTEGPGSSFALGGGFLDEAGEFDARFFGISPREALAMDPQQRLLLETSWELLERAGIDPAALRDSRTGVFVGTMDQEYGPRLHEAPEALDGYLLTGKTSSVASGRIAYSLGLTGPALTVDTACSSSLVALHLAVQSLRRGESSLALAGGVTVLNTPGIFTEFSRQRGLSRDGRCKAFAASADGTGMGEGAGMLLVERLSDAERNGHRVLAVIRGSAVNQDGASNGLTAPSGRSQQQVIREALADAGVASSDVDVVEAHGTGTALGDPIEAQALLATYGQDRPAERPLLLGSVKSNIGHTQAAAGVAGVIKMVMAMQEGLVPRTLHVDEPSPQVDWASGAVELVTRSEAWPETGPESEPGRVRRAGVSSFGISGTNAHVIVEGPPAVEKAPVPAGSSVVRDRAGVVPWLVSGRSVAGLRGQAARLGEFIAATDASPVDVGWSLAVRRAALEHRAVVVAEGREEFVAGLEAIAAGEPSGAVVSGTAPGGSDARVVFVFPGQGSQWAGMAAELLDSSPVFADSVGRCGEALSAYTDWSLLDVLRSRPGVPSLERVDVVQPVLWAVMVSLGELWRSRGVEPAAVVGHSQGEIAAACVAGALSLEDGARIVALRSAVIAGELAGHGGMLSVAASAARVAELLGDREGVWVATVNGPAATVVAGGLEQLDRVAEDAEAAGVRTRRVPVDYASHTPHVEAVREQLTELAAPVAPRAGHIPMWSTVTGDGPVAGEDLDAAYWYRNLREQVRFHETIDALIGEGHTIFVEVSAHPVLTAAIEEAGHAADKPLTVTGTLRREQGGERQFLTSLAALWVRGVAPDWTTVLPVPDGDPVDLPTYAFQRSRYWLAPTGSAPEVRVDLPAEPGPESGSDALEGFPRRVAEAATAAQRKQVVLREVCRQAAAVLGWSSADEVEVGRAFRDLGFDSLSGVELRNRLVAATGLALSPTAVFDHPTPDALAEYLRDAILGVDTTAAAPGTSVATFGGSDEPIAIVSTSCRFPGGVRSPEELWDVLLSDHDVISGFPTDRGWNFDELYHPDTTRPGSCYVHQGGFLHDAGEFDAGFFGISPREAVAMDPQQRLLLETSWESLERAGIDPLSLRGSRTGVFVGVVPQGYGTGAPDANGSLGYLFTGSAGSVTSGRIAYSLGLTGPAITVDTACSSSLVALHLAVRALRNGECGMALVGGASVMSTPGIFTEFSHQRGLAPDGRCKPFAASADGTAWAEGAGVLLVERLSDAERNGHQVLAVIRGSAVNQDGASNGLTAPNGPSQERVIREALADAGLVSTDVDVVEAHGTGTALGDPIEAQALLATYGQGRDADRPLLLGSVKSNIGHTQAAAGVAGVIKMVLAMQAGIVPRMLHVDEPTPHVDWSSGAVELVTRNAAWPESDRVRRAAVSSFGVSGTNAHVIVEGPPVVEKAPVAVESSVPVESAVVRGDAGVVPWLVSGRSVAGLRGQAARLGEFAAATDASPVDVGWSLALCRAALEHRAVVVAEGREEFVAGLEAIAAGEPSGAVVSGAAQGGSDAGVVFVFPGQGSQWAGMAAELLDRSPVFADSVGRCGEALSAYTDWSLLDVLRSRPGAPSLERVDVVQPALWAVMVSLGELWRSRGVEPAAVVGHSQGEIAAACVAGVLSLEDGARVVALRSKVIGAQLAGQGGMVSLARPVGQVTELLAPWDGRVCVAAVNGPEATVVAGDAAALDELMDACEREGVRARRVPVDYASHSPHVEAVREQLMEVAEPVAAGAGSVPMYSTVTGGLVAGDGLDAGYWYRNLRERVRFQETIDVLIGEGHTTFVEVSAHPVLTGAIEEAGHAADRPLTVTGTLRRDHGGERQFLTALAALWVHGVAAPDWTTVLPAPVGAPVDLPTYAFQRDHYWLAPAAPALTTAPDTHAEFWAAVEREDLDELGRTLEWDGDRTELLAVLPALSAWHRRHSAASALDSWRYREDWEPLTERADARVTGAGTGAGPGAWLVAVAPDQVGSAVHEAVVERLRTHGATVETLVAPDDPQQWPDTLAARAQGQASAAGVVSLLALDERPDTDAAASPGEFGGFRRTLLLIQALAAAQFAAPVWCVTRGAVSVSVDDGVTAPAQALVWGLGRAVAQELPTLWGGLIDLPEETDRPTLDRLCAVLAAEGNEDQIALRAAGAFGRRLVRAPLGDIGRTDWKPGSGTVLITGGTGALGSQVARRLADRGAEHLLLVSRRGRGAPGAADLEAELVRAGARVTVAACDIADDDALRELLASVPADCPLTSVFHTAAVLDDAAVEALTPEQADGVLRVKAGAAWRLHELTLDRELSAFVLFSSVAGSVGMAGQGNYAPANAYVDALARYRRSRGLTATSVAWGPWAEGGMADADAVAGLRIRHGLPLLPPETAVLGLEAALEHGETAVVVADIDWDRFIHAYTAVRPSGLFDGIPEARRALGAADDSPAAVAGERTDTSLRDRLADADPRERKRHLRDAVRTQVAAVLGHDSAQSVGAGRQFLDLGLDSVTAVELRNRLAGITGIRLPVTVIFDHPTVNDLVAHLDAELFETAADGTDATGTPDTPGTSGAAGAADLTAATNDELFTFIEKEFGIS
ncbi:hypothetical protein DEJ48_13470 [Streptomyces venezuelae]|uniref:Polyketide synthase n=1 Tax=Streptomyces venezuelae TaxID=54571 RepID=A0A5P2BX77_STRVZ|nr:type I polyketide synthase [Streptomyces venezuelae]QES34268.1 hypothetical protein DEJ48_13470 [Streptomyces venezuelae]